MGPIRLRTSEMFDWTQDDPVLPKLLYRLYRPKPSLYADPGPMTGDDDTISIPTIEERAKMCEVLKRLDESRDWNALTHSSRWMKAVIRDDPSPRMVRCFTFDAPLALADRPFGRATRVFRVILEDALQSSGPPLVYTLKDTWRRIPPSSRVSSPRSEFPPCILKSLSTSCEIRHHLRRHAVIRGASARASPAGRRSLGRSREARTS